MTTAMRRSIGMITATALLVAGCSAGQGDPKVALTVGDVKVSTVEQVQRTLTDLLATNQGAQDQARQHKLDQVSRGIITQQAVNQLTAEAARRAGIQIPDALAEEAIPQLTGPAATEGDPFQATVDAAFPAKELARYRLALAELGARAIGRTAITFDAAFPQNFEDARELARKVAADPAQSAALMQAVPNPQQEAAINQTQSSASAQNATQLLQIAGFPLFNIPVGSVVATRLEGEQGGYVVFYMKAKQTAAPPAGFDVGQIPLLDRSKVGRAQLMDVALKTRVEPNPRFGTWDPFSLRVVSAEEAAVASAVYQAAATKP
ncbi:hypothetical protein [Kibdelosporangium aridum]|uniref:SurA N-terminal domain-containing protein n=1 Tax=Kibdelosporangium aridum TaxID=2030 RepID=A0A1W2EZI4_KIBAR|nr:hypothetical protein [Kibdelosporangium aridum]SMD14982.1 hypothetical protein SAMN05661093_05182 [Kibdelosporangium aridum]